MSYFADSNEGGADGTTETPEPPEHHEPHVAEHDGSNNFPEVHLIDTNLIGLFEFNDKNVSLPEPHEQEAPSSKERDFVLALGIGSNLSFGKYGFGANIGVYLIVNLDSKSTQASFRIGTSASIGTPGSASEKAPNGFGFEGSIGPTLTAGFGDASKGYFGPANSLSINGPALAIATVNTPDYKSVTISEGVGAGLTVERTTTVSTGEFDSFDLQRCYYELNQYIIRGTGN